MMKMFTNEEVKNDQAYPQRPDGGVSDTSSINDRMMDTAAAGQTKQSPGLRPVDFDLTKTNKSKGVTFSANSKRPAATIDQISQGHVKDGIEDIKAQFDEMRARTLAV